MVGIPQLPPLNCTNSPVDFTRFASLSISPVRDAGTDAAGGTCIEICAPDEATMISVYGITHDGEAECLTDEPDAIAALRIAKLLSMEHQLPVSWFDEVNGAIPREPTRDLKILAEWLTDIIHDDIDDGDRDDAFDAHPLAPLRETAVLLSEYAGLDTALHPLALGAV